MTERAEADERLVANTIVLACVGMMVGTFLRFVETQLVPIVRNKLPRFALPPYTLSVFLAGAAASVGYDAEARRVAAGGEPSERGEASILGAISSAQLIDPHVVLLALLPPLIYESSSSMNYHTFRRVRWQALLLAFPGVLLQTFLTAAAMRYLAGYGTAEEGGLWDWDVALTFGAIVSATDPVAVVSVLKALGAPEKLSDIIDGESLLNDGSAMVVFGIFAHNVTAVARGVARHGLASGVGFFMRLSLGGVALGAFAFYVVVSWLTYVENDFRVEVTVLLIGVFGAFALAELALGVSGVLAVVTFGLLMARRGLYTFSPHAAAVAESVVPMLAFISETLIFFIGGIAAWTALSSYPEQIAWWHAIPLYVGLMAVRALTVAVFYPFLARTGYRVTRGECCMIVYAGLRGAVGLALSLLVVRDEHFPPIDKGRIHFLVGSVVVLTMAINGTTTQALYDWLDLYPASKFRDVVVHEAICKLEGAGMAAIREELITKAHLHLYALADWEVVRRMVPSFSDARVTRSDALWLPPTARVDPLETTLVRRIATSAPRAPVGAGGVHTDSHEQLHADAPEDEAFPATATAAPAARRRPHLNGDGTGAPRPIRAASAAPPPTQGGSALELSTEPPSPLAPRRQRSHTVDALPASGARGARHTDGDDDSDGDGDGALVAAFFGAGVASAREDAPSSRHALAPSRATDPRVAWRTDAAAQRRARREDTSAGRRSEGTPWSASQSLFGSVARGGPSGLLGELGDVLPRETRARSRPEGRPAHERTHAPTSGGAAAARTRDSSKHRTTTTHSRAGDAREADAAGGASAATSAACSASSPSASASCADFPTKPPSAEPPAIEPAAAPDPTPDAESAAAVAAVAAAHAGARGTDVVTLASRELDAAERAAIAAVVRAGGGAPPTRDAHDASARAQAASPADSPRGAPWRAGALGARWARRARALSSECSFYEKKVELVGALFSILRRAYMEQYEAKQLDGAALAVCMEGLSSGEEYLYDHPIASPTGAFELELDVLLYELPPPSPAWLPYLLMLPSVGRALWRNQIFRRTYVVTEALAAYIHAHDELRKLCAPDPRKAALLRDAVEPALHRARLRLQEHRLRYWSLTTLQINLLTARAAIDLKRKQVRALGAAGDLTATNVSQLTGALDSALYAVETIRYSALAPRRFHRKLRLVLRALDLGAPRIGRSADRAADAATDAEASANRQIAAAAQRAPPASAQGSARRAVPAHSALNSHQHSHDSHVQFAGAPP